MTEQSGIWVVKIYGYLAQYTYKFKTEWEATKFRENALAIVAEIFERDEVQADSIIVDEPVEELIDTIATATRNFMDMVEVDEFTLDDDDF